MKTFARHLVVAALPLALGLAAAFAFTLVQGSCVQMVGPVFAAKCHGRQLEYQLLIQSAGTALGTLLAAMLGTWLELRARHAVQQPKSNNGVNP
ncbi:MAG TPA: hypothetical protein VLV16_11060 [Gemmatimonadales bacterium]|nr:hypothetical protein [Gemmatimonadales bacterium]